MVNASSATMTYGETQVEPGNMDGFGKLNLKILGNFKPFRFNPWYLK